MRESAQDHPRPPEARVLYVGSLIPRKGVGELLRGFALACADEPACALEVVGTGPQLPELQRLAAGLGVLPRVRFHGFLQGDEVARLAGRCGVFVCPSHRELWGLVINEAMACGLPVIATRNAGATSDLIVDGVNGFVVDPASPDDIAAKLGVLVRDPERAREMGRSAAVDVRERASLARSAEGFIAGIEIALGHRNAGARRSRPASSQPGARPRT